MYSDSHLHTAFSTDSVEKPEVQIEQAISLGMKGICITDHQDFEFPEKYPMTYQFDSDAYWSEMSRLKDLYRDRIDVRIGVELGMKLDIAPKLKRYARQYDFDFVIGSLHLVRDTDVMYPEYFQGRTQREAYGEYFETLYKNLQSDIDIDVIGHIDYVVRYGPKLPPHRCSDYREIIDEILKAAIAKGRGIECNTGGFRAGLGTPNPSQEILKRYAELGGEILTVGSDAHRKEHLGFCFGELGGLLKSCGFRYYTIFRQRKPEFLPL